MGPRLIGNCHGGACEFAATLCALALVCLDKMNMFGASQHDSGRRARVHDSTDNSTHRMYYCTNFVHLASSSRAQDVHAGQEKD